MRALPLDGVEHVRGHVIGRVEDVVEVQRRERRLEPERERVRPVAQLVAVAVGHAEHVGDHLERQREREVGDHLHRVAARDDGVERGVDELLHARRELLDRARREHLLHDPADARVIGRIDVEHAAGAPLGPLTEHLLPQLGAWVRALDRVVLDAELGVTEEPEAVVVAEQHPGPERALLHRVLLEQEPVLGVRVLGEAGLERVEAGQRVRICRGGPCRLIRHTSNSTDLYRQDVRAAPDRQ